MNTLSDVALICSCAHCVAIKNESPDEALQRLRASFYTPRSNRVMQVSR